MLQACSPSFLFCVPLDFLPNLQSQVGQLGQTDIVAGVQRTEDVFNGRLYSLHQLFPSAVKQPPTECKVSPIRFKVIAQGLCHVVIMVFQADGRVCMRSSKRDNAGKVVPPAEEVELDAGEDGEQRERVDKGKRPCDSCVALEMELPIALQIKTYM